MQVNTQLFRGYDLRGLVGKDLSPELALHLGKAYGTYLTRRDMHTAVCSLGALSVCAISGVRNTASNSPEASFHSHSVERDNSTPWRLKIIS